MCFFSLKIVIMYTLTYQRGRIMEEKLIRHLSDIFDQNIYVDISSNISRVLDDHRIYRNLSFPADAYTISFMTLNDKTGELETVAFLMISLLRYGSIEEAKAILEDYDGDRMDAVEYVEELIETEKKNYDEDIFDPIDIQICDLHNFYVSPKYRGKGVSEALTLRLPQIIEELSPASATYISTYINPFVDQLDIGLAKELNERGFGGYSKGMDVDMDEVRAAAKKSLERCGFVNVGNDHYVIDCADLAYIAEKNEVHYETTSQTCEYEE